MDIRMKDLERMLDVPERTLLKWVREKKIPSHRIGRQYLFNREEINEWILHSGSELADRLLDVSILGRVTRLATLITQGGVHDAVAGESVAEVLRNGIEAMRTPASVSKSEIVAALMDRESLMSTAVGGGIAIPHPRNPIIADIEDASVAICYLEHPVDFGALDRMPVGTMFIILSFSPKRHLEVLSKISYLCRDDRFLGLLRQRAPLVRIVDFVTEREEEWRAKERHI